MRLDPRIAVAALTVIVTGCDAGLGPKSSNTVTLCIPEALAFTNDVYLRDEGDSGFAEGNSWRLLPPNQSLSVGLTATNYSFTFAPPKRFSLATVFNIGSYPYVYMRSLTVDDVSKLTCPTGLRANSHTYALTLKGVSKSASISAGLERAFAYGDTTFSFLTYADTDLVATSGVPTSVIIRRRANAMSAGTFGPLDFSSSEALALQSVPLTINGVGSDPIAVSVSLGVRGTTAGLGETVAVGGSGTFGVLPASSQEATDWYVLSVSGSPSISSTRKASVRFTSRSPRTLDLGAALSPPTVAVLNQFTPRGLRLTVQAQPEYGDTLSLFLGDLNGRIMHFWMTSSFRGAGNWTFETPDPARLSAAALQMTQSGALSWSTGGGGSANGSTPLEQVVRSATGFGTIKVP